MKKILICLLIVNPILVKSQVGVGTNSPNPSAILDVSSSNKGFLPPRVTLASISDLSTILNPATGLLVYNTATAGIYPDNVTPGFYYFNGLKWIRLVNPTDNTPLNPGSVGIVSVCGNATVNNSLVTPSSLIFVTTQTLYNGTAYPAVVYNKTNGAFSIRHQLGDCLNVAYFIINQ